MFLGKIFPIDIMFLGKIFPLGNGIISANAKSSVSNLDQHITLKIK